MRVLLDTNVLIAAVVAEGLCRELVRTRILPHQLVASLVLIEELTEKLETKFGVEASSVPLLQAYRERVEVVDSVPLAHSVCRDPDDDHVLSAAVVGHADCIVTGDQDLLVLKEYEGIPILSPREFLEWLDGGESEQKKGG